MEGRIKTSLQAHWEQWAANKSLHLTGGVFRCPASTAAARWSWASSPHAAAVASKALAGPRNTGLAGWLPEA